MKMASLRLITFDITDTLVQIPLPLGQQYSEALKKIAHISSDPAVISKSFKRVFKLHEKTYPVFGKIDGLTTKVWWRSVVFDTFITSNLINPLEHGMSKKLVSPNDSLGLWHIEDRSNRIEQTFEYLYDHFAYEPVPHAHQLLSFLKLNCNVFLGAISNSDERILIELERAGLRDYFDFTVTSTDCGFEKPDKRFFEYALNVAKEKLSLENPIHPSSVVHVGDRFKEDYQGSIDAGFYAAILLDNKNKRSFDDNVDPDHFARDLTDVLEKIKTILGA